MDNPALHKYQETETIINDAGYELIFLPPYSLDFNPIEKFWANLKRFIRNTINHIDTVLGEGGVVCVGVFVIIVF